MNTKQLIAEIIDACKHAQNKQLSEDELLEEAMGGYGGNGDDAFGLGFTEGRGDMAGELLFKINAYVGDGESK